MLPGPSTDAPFECSYLGCTAKYRRKEHLKRHTLQHNQEGHVSCPYCERRLTRSDLLRRHIRIHHPQRQLPHASRAQKACSACRARKERCEGGLPCNSCQQRGITCSIAGGSTRDEGDTNTEVQATPALSKSTEALSGAFQWNVHDYTNIYFNTFHPVWPFLHMGTFDPAKEPRVLVQSVVMIGLWVNGGKEARDAAMELYRRLRTAINAQRGQWDISDSEPGQNTRTSWPMATYQAVLLHIIFAVLIAKEKATFDLSLRYPVQAEEYDLLMALVQSCRRLNVLSYPNMLAQYDATAPAVLVWVGVEETKRFGLALYKVCRMCTCPDSAGSRSQLLSLADLSFGMPDSDEAWNASADVGSEILQRVALQTNLRENGDPEWWISRSSTVLYDKLVDFDWI